MENILKIIQENSLTIRCLPEQVISYLTYREGDENRIYVDGDGNCIEDKREVVVQEHDLEYFQKQKPSKWCTDSPEVRFRNWKKNFPNGRKILKVTKKIKRAGWWFVKETKNTDSSVQFNQRYDFFAPTLDEAINLYLNSKK